jgi:sigma-B regulation protein RsbU (phosphoserine phosphatase)
MEATTLGSLRQQLADRHRRLSDAIRDSGPAEDLVDLLKLVDSALSRLGDEHFGRCAVCREDIDESDLTRNPLLQYCLCALSPEQQNALQHDLDLAWRIQSALLPDPDLRSGGWTVHYRYEPAGPVSGDYCDLWESPEDGVHFFIGDVSGKGVSASLVMAHLNAAFRARFDSRLPLPELVAQANQLLLRSTIPSHYATLVCGRAAPDGGVQIVNAGHCPPIAVRGDAVETLGSTGFPVGLLEGKPYEVRRVELAPGDLLFLYTDGLTEARDAAGVEYGAERVAALARRLRGLAPRELAAACRSDLASFLGGAHRTDDLTLMVLQRTNGATPR